MLKVFYTFRPILLQKQENVRISSSDNISISIVSKKNLLTRFVYENTQLNEGQ